MSSTAIEWADSVWNPVVGCTPVSAGCLNCYAATMARRLEGMGKAGYQPREIGLISADGTIEGDGMSGPRTTTRRIAEVRGGRAVFTGDVRTLPDRLTEPLRWRKPRRIFVCSMADLFHEAVPFDFVDRVFAVAALCSQHQFLVLTKRPERMAEYFSNRTWGDVCQTARDEARETYCAPVELERLADLISHERAMRDAGATARYLRYSRRDAELPDNWPLSNVWLGTSVEDQAAADERIPHLLRCPAAVRFLSVEPLLGPVELGCIPSHAWPQMDSLHGTIGSDCQITSHERIDWVIVGGESGPKARPCDVGWIRSVVRQCANAAVPCFVKQLGARPIECAEPLPVPQSAESIMRHGEYDPDPIEYSFNDRKGGDPSEWPEDLRVRQMPVIGGAA